MCVIARLVQTLLSHIDWAGIYFFVACLHLLWRILATVLYGTLNGKILKKFVCEIIFFQIWISGVMIRKTYMHWYLYFLQTVKNSANFLLVSAIPETSSMTIRLSIEYFSQKPEILSLVTTSLALSLNFSINSASFLLDFAKWNSTLCWKKPVYQLLFGHLLIYFVTHFVWTNLQKHLLTASFCRKYVFPHSALPTTNKFLRKWTS